MSFYESDVSQLHAVHHSVLAWVQHLYMVSGMVKVHVSLPPQARLTAKGPATSNADQKDRHAGKANQLERLCRHSICTSDMQVGLFDIAKGKDWTNALRQSCHIPDASIIIIIMRGRSAELAEAETS